MLPTKHIPKANANSQLERRYVMWYEAEVEDENDSAQVHSLQNQVLLKWFIACDYLCMQWTFGHNHSTLLRTDSLTCTHTNAAFKCIWSLLIGTQLL